MRKYFVLVVVGFLLIGSCVLTAPVYALDVAIPPDFNTYTIGVNNGPSEGYFYICPTNRGPRGGSGENWSIIMDNDGNVKFFLKGTRNMFPFPDINIISVGLGRDGNGFMDLTYTMVDTITPANDLAMDGHDIAIFGEGDDRTYWVLVKDPRPVDMSELVEDGNPDAIVTGHGLQKFNAAKEVVWEWYSLDHTDQIPITDLDDPEKLLGDEFEHLHTNALWVDNEEGTVMISNRSQSDIAKIKIGADDTYADGEVIWRLGGGRGNQFEFVDDEVFLSQHDISKLDNGNILLFDDGYEDSLHYTRATEYTLDEDLLTATLVWSYTQDPPSYTGNQGGAFREASGNTCIAWGGARSTDINSTEVTAEGEIAWQIIFDPLEEGGFIPENYRLYKSDMIGVAAIPYVVTYLDDQTVEVTCNWFGHEEEVASYDVFMGESPDPAEVHGNTNTGTYVIEDLAYDTDYYFRIKAFDGDGNEISEFSNQLMITPLNAVEDDDEYIVPQEFELSQNYPNPFNPVTTLSVKLPYTSRLKVQVYDIVGRQVASLYNGVMPAGSQELKFDGNSLASGIYFVKMNVPGKFEQVRKIVLMK
ncbi:aryl-sulfate sulfotransferase [Calditrichota bacterium]